MTTDYVAMVAAVIVEQERYAARARERGDERLARFHGDRAFRRRIEYRRLTGHNYEQENGR